MPVYQLKPMVQDTGFSHAKIISTSPPQAMTQRTSDALLSSSGTGKSNL